MRLIGRKGTIDVLTPERIQITYSNGEKRIAPIKDLVKYIQELEIIGTEDGSITMGEW